MLSNISLLERQRERGGWGVGGSFAEPELYHWYKFVANECIDWTRIISRFYIGTTFSHEIEGEMKRERDRGGGGGGDSKIECKREIG